MKILIFLPVTVILSLLLLIPQTASAHSLTLSCSPHILLSMPQPLDANINELLVQLDGCTRTFLREHPSSAIPIVIDASLPASLTPAAFQQALIQRFIHEQASNILQATNTCSLSHTLFFEFPWSSIGFLRPLNTAPILNDVLLGWLPPSIPTYCLP